MFLWVITLACVLSATGSVVPCGQVITDRSSRIKNHRLVKRLTGEQAVAAGHAAAEIWKILGFLTSAADDGNFAASISDMNIMRCTIQELGGDIGFDSDESFRTALVPRIGDDPVWLPFLVREAKIFAGIQYVSYLEQTRQHAVEVHGRDLFKELIEKNDKREKTYRTRVYSRTAKLRTEAREASDIILLIPQDAKTYSVDFKIGSAALAKYRKWLVERIAFYDQNNLAAGDGEDIQEFVLDWVIAVEFRTTVALRRLGTSPEYAMMKQRTADNDSLVLALEEALEEVENLTRAVDLFFAGHFAAIHAQEEGIEDSKDGLIH